MRLVIGIFLLGICGSYGYPRPAPQPMPLPIALPWSPFLGFEEAEPRQDYEYVGATMIGQMISPRVIRNPQPGAIDFVEKGVNAGINFLDNLVPPVYQSAVRPIDPRVGDTLKNFTRPRRHENVTESQSETFQTTISPTTETVTLVTPMEMMAKATAPPMTSMTAVMEDKMDVTPLVAPPTTSSNAKADAAELEAMIKQLNNALVYIQQHGNENIHEEINNSTSTQKLVQYISAQVEILTKNKNIENRQERIKQISKALEILLNRIAKSAKPLIVAKQNSGENKNKPDPMLMARIVQHVAELKKSVISDKINNGYELTSAELDGGLPARFRPVRQQGADADNADENENKIDDDDDQEGVGNDINKDVEQISSTTTMKTNEVTAKQEENSDQQSSSQEGGGNLVANLLSSFLGSLSKPNGAVDVDAIVALVGGLSVQKDDGTFDFSGLTDLLQSFLGGDGDEGGSDVGAFLGGLLGAIIQGSANPPGPVGTGRFTGNLLANILPGLSGPAPPQSGEEGMQPQGKPIDSGSFLAGLLTSMLGASSGTSSGSSGHKQQAPMNGNGNGNGNGADNHKMGSASFFMTLKQQLFKTIFGLITSILGASSGGISQASSASGAKFQGKH